MVSTFPLDSLPENLLIEICSKLAAASVKEVLNLQRVSKKYQRLTNDRYVLRRMILHDRALRRCFPIPTFHTEFGTFFDRCLKAGNPEAEFRYGAETYFDPRADEQRQQIGLERIESAARQGLGLAQFFYGSIQLSNGGLHKEQGLEMLKTVQIPLMHWGPTYTWIADPWMVVIDSLRWPARTGVYRLKSSYVRDQCKCDGVKEGLIADPGCMNTRHDLFKFLIDNMRPLSCPICFGHQVLQIFFVLMEA